MLRKVGLVLTATVFALGIAATTVQAQGSTVLLNGVAQVTTADLEASNGVIHVIDSVLQPPAAGTATADATLASTDSVTLEATLESTLSATTDAYATSEATLDSTLDATSEATLDGTVAATSEVAAQTIVDIAAGNPEFSTLVALVTKAGLVETLSGAGPFTVFAPTNAAFEAYAAANGTTVDALSNLDAATLTEVLTYHVVAGQALKAADLSALSEVTTVNGGVITITVQ